MRLDFASRQRRWIPVVLAVWIAAVLPCRAQSTDVPPVVQLDEAVASSSELPRLHSLLVSWRGDLILERYFNGIRPTRPANIKSASKSVISALVGVAVGRGLIPRVTQPIEAYFPELRTDPSRLKRTITVEDLLTMRSGLDSTSNRNYGAWVQSRNWVRYVLARPVVAQPGTTMEYSTGNSHLLSAILTKVTGTSTWQFAQDALAKPLGISLARWLQDPQGVYFGGNDMSMTPRQMVAFGELYLGRGRYKGQQVVPAEWVAASFVPRGQSRWSDQFYGYGWWMRELGGYQAYFAWGFGGQYIFVMPDLDLVVVTTSSTSVDEERGGGPPRSIPGGNGTLDKNEERRSHRRTIFDVIERLIVPRVAAVAPGITPRNLPHN